MEMGVKYHNFNRFNKNVDVDVQLKKLLIISKLEGS